MKLLLITCVPVLVCRLCLADSIPLIAVDIGHSTLFPGALSARGKPEFEFNVALARSLQQILSSHQLNSLLIGEDGQMTNLKRRPVVANSSQASLFLSIHHDSAQPEYLKRWQWQDKELRYSDQFSGFSLFVSRENPYPTKSLACARMMGKALKQFGFSSSNHHAKAIAGENLEWADRDLGVYYYDELIVLKNATMPAVLLEAGVIINRADEQELQNDSTRNRIASAVTQGIKNCLIWK